MHFVTLYFNCIRTLVIMKRRSFLSLGIGIGGSSLIYKGLPISSRSACNALEGKVMSESDDRVLVLLQLNGGNDGLNTIVPLKEYGRLAQYRPTLIIPENDLITVSDELAFHPALKGFRSLYQEQQLQIIHSVGYPDQNRSHFRSTEIWMTASEAKELKQTGWLGRYLDTKYPGFPTSYPNSTYRDPFAINMGFQVSETCQGQMANFGVTLDAFTSVNLTTDDYQERATESLHENELNFISRTIEQTQQYNERILEAADLGTNLAEYPNTELGRHLKLVANLISGGLNTKVYTVSLSGFDTHALQVDKNDSRTGRHTALLTTIDQAVRAFQSDLNKQKLSRRVLGMTFSEFGRQIKENGSYGTDHGTAAPLFLFGECVKQQNVGSLPEIPEEVGEQEGVALQYDFRDVFGSIIRQWFGEEYTQTEVVMEYPILNLDMIKQCDSEQSVPTAVIPTVIAFPNPFREVVKISFDSEAFEGRLSIFDAIGTELEVLSKGKFRQGRKEFEWQAAHFPSGNYYFRLVFANEVITRNIVKV